MVQKQENEIVGLPWDRMTPEERARRAKRFTWDDDEDDGLTVIRHDDEARQEVIASLEEKRRRS